MVQDRLNRYRMLQYRAGMSWYRSDILHCSCNIHVRFGLGGTCVLQLWCTRFRIWGARWKHALNYYHMCLSTKHVPCAIPLDGSVYYGATILSASSWSSFSMRSRSGGSMLASTAFNSAFVTSLLKFFVEYKAVHHQWWRPTEPPKKHFRIARSIETRWPARISTESLIVSPRERMRWTWGRPALPGGWSGGIDEELQH